MNTLAEIKKLLKKYDQEHLLANYDNFNEEDKQKLLDQIAAINFDFMLGFYGKLDSFEESGSNSNIEPIDAFVKAEMTEEELNKCKETGINLIKQGKYAVLTMAGGQGTRLGHEGPKGSFIVELKEPRPIFSILCERFKETKEKYDVVVPWYIMTSNENDVETRAFFKENNYFNYSKEDIIFFKQSEIEMIDTNGKILLDEFGFIKNAPTGHGATFEALKNNNILDDMKKRGIEWVYIGGVDNIIAQLVDPIFIGLSANKNVLIAGKSLIQVGPEEKVGVFCKKNGKPSVVEYTEISDDMARQVNVKEELLYGEGHILCNLFNIKALDIFAKEGLKYHPAFKKINSMNEKGEVVKPNSPNAYKLEAFIFDYFELMDDMLIFRVIREEEFAPIKNKEGVDSPATAIELYENYYK